MSKLDLVLARVRQLPPERQETVAMQIDLFLDDAEQGGILTDEEWAAIEPTLDLDSDEIPHAQMVAEFGGKPA